jgi:hypothetical protein
MSASAKPEIADTIKAFINRAHVDPARLLQLLKQWRLLQSGSSHDKCKQSAHNHTDRR